jgi:hypothetical protein
MTRRRSGKTASGRNAAARSQRERKREPSAAGLARDLDALACRYRLLEQYALGPPGRTPARRDLIRAISSEFPGALRELDQLGLDAIRSRAAVVARLRDELARGAGVNIVGDPRRAWIRYLIALTPRLRQVLAIKRWLAHNPARAASPHLLRASVRAWYAARGDGERVPGDELPDDDLIDRVRRPAGGQVQQVAYRETARALGISVAELKRVIFSEASPDDDRFPD